MQKQRQLIILRSKKQTSQQKCRAWWFGHRRLEHFGNFSQAWFHPCPSSSPKNHDCQMGLTKKNLQSFCCKSPRWSWSGWWKRSRWQLRCKSELSGFLRIWENNSFYAYWFISKPEELRSVGIIDKQVHQALVLWVDIRVHFHYIIVHIFRYNSIQIVISLINKIFSREKSKI